MVRFSLRIHPVLDAIREYHNTSEIRTINSFSSSSSSFSFSSFSWNCNGFLQINYLIRSTIKLVTIQA